MAQTLVGRGELGVELHGALVSRQGVVELAERRFEISELHQARGIRRCGLERGAEVIACLLPEVQRDEDFDRGVEDSGRLTIKRVCALEAAFRIDDMEHAGVRPSCREPGVEVQRVRFGRPIKGQRRLIMATLLMEPRAFGESRTCLRAHGPRPGTQTRAHRDGRKTQNQAEQALHSLRGYTSTAPVAKAIAWQSLHRFTRRTHSSQRMRRPMSMV